MLNSSLIEINIIRCIVWDEDNHTTKLYEKEIKVKKLPRTGT